MSPIGSGGLNELFFSSLLDLLNHVDFIIYVKLMMFVTKGQSETPFCYH